MAALIDEVVNITITRDTLGITRADFGTILIIGDTFNNVAEVKTYTSLAEVGADYIIIDQENQLQVQTPEYIIASKIFAQVIKPTKILIAQQTTGDGSIITTYQRVSLMYGNQFYAVLSTADASENTVLELAAVVETQTKIYGVSCNNSAVLTDSESILSKLHALNYNRTFLIYGGYFNPLEYPAAAWMGRMLPVTPGSATWAYKNLVGVKPDSLNSVQRTNIKANKGNFYSSLAGVPVTFEGTMVSGEYIDVIHGLDWLESYIQENIAALLIAAPKIPYDNNGIGLVENSLRASLKEAALRGIINEDFIITTPDILDVSRADKASRTLTNVKFTAVLTGAIQNIIINGVVTV
jgi:Protein of unknown function (DUF3383)